MSISIHPCLWFDNNAREAAELYSRAFDNSRIMEENQFVVNFELFGELVMGLNGGPYHTINPSISFMVTYDDPEEIDRAWEVLTKEGIVLMPLDKYGWSDWYGWVQDKYGVSWQLFLGTKPDLKQRINPTLMFTGKQHGNAEKALNYYTSIFDNSNIQGILRYDADENEVEGTVKHSQFTLNGYTMMAMDSSIDHNFQFSEGLSLVVTCDTQEEIDYYWDNLKKGGTEDQCGWLKDQFGVSWQIVPKILGELMQDQEKATRVVAEFMKMKKFDIEKLKNA